MIALDRLILLPSLPANSLLNLAPISTACWRESVVPTQSALWLNNGLKLMARQAKLCEPSTWLPSRSKTVVPKRHSHPAVAGTRLLSFV
jgi:hypothetical protein